jgi:ribosomal protein S1
MIPEEKQPQSSLDAEIEASLEGVNLQDIGAPVSGGSRAASKLQEGVVVGVTGQDVFVELGPRNEGVVPLSEFEELPTPGQRLQVSLVGKDGDLNLLSIKEAKAIAAWEEMEVGSLAKATCTGMNKGGLELKIGSVSAFMPASQIAIGRVDDLAAYAGQAMVCEVTEIDRGRKRIVLSRRKVLEVEAAAKREKALGTLSPGSVLRGKVTRLENYGAFVDIGGIEGLMHVSNISHKRLGHPEEALTVGQDVEVQVLEITDGGKRISLGMKQLETDPWDGFAERHVEDSIITGTVQRLTDFGAFIELEPGVDGLLHVSQMGTGRVRTASDVLSMGEEVAVRIQKIDTGARRISLSRLDSRGAVLGSDEAVDSDVIDQVLQEGAQASASTNLGALLRRAMEDGEKK